MQAYIQIYMCNVSDGEKAQRPAESICKVFIYEKISHSILAMVITPDTMNTGRAEIEDISNSVLQAPWEMFNCQYITVAYTQNTHRTCPISRHLLYTKRPK